MGWSDQPFDFVKIMLKTCPTSKFTNSLLDFLNYQVYNHLRKGKEALKMKKTYYYYGGRYRGIAMILALPIFGIIIAIKEEIDARACAKRWNNREKKHNNNFMSKYKVKE